MQVDSAIVKKFWCDTIQNIDDDMHMTCDQSCDVLQGVYNTATPTSYDRNTSVCYYAWGGVLELVTTYKW